jgi:hypothetical protein
VRALPLKKSRITVRIYDHNRTLSIPENINAQPIKALRESVSPSTSHPARAANTASRLRMIAAWVGGCVSLRHKGATPNDGSDQQEQIGSIHPFLQAWPTFHHPNWNLLFKNSLVVLVTGSSFSSPDEIHRASLASVPGFASPLRYSARRSMMT